MRTFAIGIGLLSILGTASRADAQSPPRVVSLGGSVTETAFALGAGASVVGVDESSLFPPHVASLPQVGYYRTISVEGVLSLAPTLVLASVEAGPPAALAQLVAAGVTVVRVPEGYTPGIVTEKIRIVASALGLGEAGDALADRLAHEMDEASGLRARAGTRPRALFIWSRGPGAPVVGGSETGASAVLELAGAENAASGMRGYQPMNAESVVLASPDVLVVPDATVASLGGLDALLRLPGVAATPAGRARRVITVDLMALLGFGPRTGEALLALTRELHPDLQVSAR
jgi:iron complex transport system substrate-binding protein